MFWRHCGGTSCTKHFKLTAKVVASQFALKVELNSVFGNGSCNLSRNDFGRCRVKHGVSCNLSQHNVAKTSRDKLHETFHSVTVPLVGSVVMVGEVKLDSTFPIIQTVCRRHRGQIFPYVSDVAQTNRKPLQIIWKSSVKRCYSATTG